jgi:hypothetical protein
VKNSRKQKIKGVLLDVGGTIAFPKSGSWFIPPNYEMAFQRNNIKAYIPHVEYRLPLHFPKPQDV